MSTEQHVCGPECRPRAVNALGVEVQAFALPAGWKSTGPIYDTYCQAEDALAAFPIDDGVERRVYTALATKKD